MQTRLSGGSLKVSFNGLSFGASPRGERRPDPDDLPNAVYIVYDGRFALTKKSRGDCQVELTAMQELLEKTYSRMSATCHRWLVKIEGRSRGTSGRPVLSIFQSDTYHKRSLRAGIPVCIENKAWTDEHRWQLDYLDGSEEGGGALGAPFHLRCVAVPRLYLAVNETLGKVEMKREKPTKPWQLMSASGRGLVSKNQSYSELEASRKSWTEQKLEPTVARQEHRPSDIADVVAVHSGRFEPPASVDRLEDKFVPPVAAALASMRMSDEAAPPAKASPAPGCLSACYRWLPPCLSKPDGTPSSSSVRVRA